MQRNLGSSTTTTSTRPQSRHGFDGQTRRAPQKSQRFSQASLRRGLHAYDQHGREWYVETEIRSGRPTGTWQAQFPTPWTPDQKYFVLNDENLSELYIDYPQMLADRRTATVGYHRDAVKLATDKEWPIPVYGEPYSGEIIGTLGNPPQPIQPIIAAKQENPFIMGWDERPDPRLVPFLPRPRTALTIEEETYDFSEESFFKAVQRPLKKVHSLSDLPKIIDTGPVDGPAVGEAVGGVEDDGETTAVIDDVRGRSGVAVLDADIDEELDRDVEAAFAAGGLDEKTEELLDLEDEIDPGSTGGQRVPVTTAPKAAQAERRPPRPAHNARHKAPPAKAPFPKGAQRARPGAGGKGNSKRPSVADGARPVIAALDDE